MAFFTKSSTWFENDYKDQIHDETARQSRWTFGIGLIIR
jgi:outer membrane receptor for ferrienterochelin and colicin